jgi:hypothetical protein
VRAAGPDWGSCLFEQRPAAVSTFSKTNASQLIEIEAKIECTDKEIETDYTNPVTKGPKDGYIICIQGKERASEKGGGRDLTKSEPTLDCFFLWPRRSQSISIFVAKPPFICAFH